MWRPRLLAMALALLPATVTSDRQYSGPQCLGPFCISQFDSGGRLFKQLGLPSRGGDLHYYRSRDGKTFLRVGMVNTGPHDQMVGNVLLSDFPNCAHMSEKDTQISADDLRAWTTREGIGLGTPEREIVRAYGKATLEYKIDATLYRHIIMGYRPGDKVPNVGDKILEYDSKDKNATREADFGIRDGKVAWIHLFT